MRGSEPAPIVALKRNLMRSDANPGDAAMIDSMFDAFADCPKVRLIHDPAHCGECAEADTYLTSLDPHDMTLADISGPIVFDLFSMATDEGFRYFLPGMCRIALEERPHGLDHFLLRFGPERASAIVQPHHRTAVREFLAYVAAMGYVQGDWERKNLRKLRACFHQSTDAA